MRRTARGFTLIEVLMALLVFTVAMLGLVALQRASISGANMGREQTAAVNVARYVMTWLENEASSWPLASTDPPPETLALFSSAIAADEDAWLPLSDGDANVRFDSYLEPSGTPLHTADVDTAQFCVHYRVKPLGNAEDPVAYQVWVRVTWPKWKQYNADTWKSCETRRTADPTVIGAYNAVELTGVASREYTSRWTADSES